MSATHAEANRVMMRAWRTSADIRAKVDNSVTCDAVAWVSLNEAIPPERNQIPAVRFTFRKAVRREQVMTMVVSARVADDTGKITCDIIGRNTKSNVEWSSRSLVYIYIMSDTVEGVVSTFRSAVLDAMEEETQP